MKNSANNLGREAGHLIRHRRSKLGRRKVFGDTKSKSKLIRHKDVVSGGSYQEPESRSQRVKRAATARPERIWDYAVIPYEIDSNFRSVLEINFIYLGVYKDVLHCSICNHDNAFVFADCLRLFVE